MVFIISKEKKTSPTRSLLFSTLYPLRRTAFFPKSPNKDSLPVYNVPSGSHWKQLRMTTAAVKEVVVLREIVLNCGTKKLIMRINS